MFRGLGRDFLEKLEAEDRKEWGWSEDEEDNQRVSLSFFVDEDIEKSKDQDKFERLGIEKDGILVMCIKGRKVKDKEDNSYDVKDKTNGLETEEMEDFVIKTKSSRVKDKKLEELVRKSNNKKEEKMEQEISQDSDREDSDLEIIYGENDDMFKVEYEREKKDVEVKERKAKKKMFRYGSGSGIVFLNMDEMSERVRTEYIKDKLEEVSKKFDKDGVLSYREWMFLKKWDYDRYETYLSSKEIYFRNKVGKQVATYCSVLTGEDIEDNVRHYDLRYCRYQKHALSEDKLSKMEKSKVDKYEEWISKSGVLKYYMVKGSVSYLYDDLYKQALGRHIMPNLPVMPKILDGIGKSWSDCMIHLGYYDDAIEAWKMNNWEWAENKVLEYIGIDRESAIIFRMKHTEYLRRVMGWKGSDDELDECSMNYLKKASFVRNVSVEDQSSDGKKIKVDGKELVSLNTEMSKGWKIKEVPVRLLILMKRLDVPVTVFLNRENKGKKEQSDVYRLKNSLRSVKREDDDDEEWSIQWLKLDDLVRKVLGGGDFHPYDVGKINRKESSTRLIVGCSNGVVEVGNYISGDLSNVVDDEVVKKKEKILRNLNELRGKIKDESVLTEKEREIVENVFVYRMRGMQDDIKDEATKKWVESKSDTSLCKDKVVLKMYETSLNGLRMYLDKDLKACEHEARKHKELIMLGRVVVKNVDEVFNRLRKLIEKVRTHCVELIADDEKEVKPMFDRKGAIEIYIDELKESLYESSLDDAIKRMNRIRHNKVERYLSWWEKYLEYEFRPNYDIVKIAEDLQELVIVVKHWEGINVSLDELKSTLKSEYDERKKVILDGGVSSRRLKDLIWVCGKDESVAKALKSKYGVQRYTNGKKGRNNDMQETEEFVFVRDNVRVFPNTLGVNGKVNNAICRTLNHILNTTDGISGSRDRYKRRIMMEKENNRKAVEVYDLEMFNLIKDSYEADVVNYGVTKSVYYHNSVWDKASKALWDEAEEHKRGNDKIDVRVGWYASVGLLKLKIDHLTNLGDISKSLCLEVGCREDEISMKMASWDKEVRSNFRKMERKYDRSQNEYRRQVDTKIKEKLKSRVNDEKRKGIGRGFMHSSWSSGGRK